MKRILTLVAIAALGFLAAGCTAATQAKIQTGLSTFAADVAAINADIRQVSSALYNNCATLQSTLGAIGGLVSPKNTTGHAIVAGNATLTSLCQSQPSNIPTAITAVASAVQTAKASFKAAAAGN